MIKTCKICTFHYHANKFRCPTCGTFQSGKYVMHTDGKTFHPVAIRVAHGAIRQEYMGVRGLRFSGLCDPDQ